MYLIHWYIHTGSSIPTSIFPIEKKFLYLTKKKKKITKRNFLQDMRRELIKIIRISE